KIYASVSCELWTRVARWPRLCSCLASRWRPSSGSLQQRREEGHVRSKALPGRPPKKRTQVEASLMPQLQAHDDATLEQHCVGVLLNTPASCPPDLSHCLIALADYRANAPRVRLAVEKLWQNDKR